MAFAGTIVESEGFDWVNTVNDVLKRKVFLTANHSGVITGRMGTGKAAVLAGDALTKSFTEFGDTTGAHFAIKVKNIGANNKVFWVLDSAGAVQLSVRFNTGGRLELWRGDITTLLATGTKICADGNWYSFQFICKANDTTGFAKLWVDEVLDIDFSGDTKQSSLNEAKAWKLSFAMQAWDDVVFYSPTSSTDKLDGDASIFTKFANANGVSSSWTPQGAATNYQCVDETAFDGDTTYVKTSTVGARDSYAMQNANVLGKVFALNQCFICRKDDVAARSIKGSIRVGATNYDNTAIVVPSAYEGFNNVMNTSPATGLAWGKAEVDTVEAAQECVT